MHDNLVSIDSLVVYSGTENLADEYRAYFKLILLEHGDNGFVLRDEEQDTILKYVPQNAIALVVPERLGAPMLEATAEWLASVGLDAPLTVHFQGLPEALLGFATRIRRGNKMSSDLMVRLSELRSVHEELQNSFDSLRGYVFENGLAPPRVGFLNLPDVDKVVLPEAVTEVLQPIPVELRSLCGISLHLDKEVSSFYDGFLQVELLAEDDDEIRISWRAPYHAFRAGWVTFAFQQGGRFLRKNPVLRLGYNMAGGDSPLFSLGTQQARPRNAAIIDGKVSTRALAFKAWASIPGAPLSIVNQMLPIIRMDGKPVTQIELSIDNTLSASDPLGLRYTSAYDPIVVLADKGRVMVHPVVTGPTIARIHDVCPTGTTMVIAEVETASERAGLIEYALAVAVQDDGSTVLSGEGLPEWEQVSDWLMLPPQVEGTVQLVMDNPLSRFKDLYLMTRVMQGHAPDYGWAYFKRIRFIGQFG